MTQLEINDLIDDNAMHLRRITDVGALEGFAVEHGLRGTADFSRFVRALRRVAGVDFAAVCALNQAQQRVEPLFAAQAGRGPRLVLWSAGTPTHFTVARTGGDLIWRERHPGARTITVARASESGAQQAIWVAGLARAEWGAQAARLRLIMARTHGVDLVGLHHSALAANLLLEVVTDPLRNPAGRAAGAPIVEWHGTDPATLIDSDEDKP
ncbi:hypothetical protein [Nocardia sp. A7]|uniref:hypothetical protein n=1 Tax=Nocardia sp. A7 TaxID=2789274 RepID=UPI00397C7A90